MSRMPTKFFVFAGAAAFVLLVVLPNRAEVAGRFLRAKRDQASLPWARILVAERIRETICRPEDACDYAPAAWEDFRVEGGSSASVIHAFAADGNKRKYLFRIREGRVSEIINLR